MPWKIECDEKAENRKSTEQWQSLIDYRRYCVVRCGGWNIVKPVYFVSRFPIEISFLSLALILRLFFPSPIIIATRCDTICIQKEEWGEDQPKSVWNCRLMRIDRQETFSRRLEVRLARLTQAIDSEAIRDNFSIEKRMNDIETRVRAENRRMEWKRKKIEMKRKIIKKIFYWKLLSECSTLWCTQWTQALP